MNQSDLFAGCPVQHALQYIGGKWQIGILNGLKKQPARFIAIKNMLPGISEKVLTQDLRFFENAGIIHRELVAGVPAQVTYSLTAEGRKLVPVIETIVQWAYAHLQEQKLDKAMLSTPLTVIQDIENTGFTNDVPLNGILLPVV